MKLIVGLGNPGTEYEKTRHNIGFMLIDKYLGGVSWKQDFNSLIYSSIINGEKIIFMKPLTFMNLSGEAVRKVVDYYNIDIENILIIQDDISLQLGKHRIKYNSTDGGHNGIKSIIKNLNTNSFLRLKIGLAKEIESDTISYVLGKLTEKEYNQFCSDYKEYKDILDKFINGGKNSIINN